MTSAILFIDDDRDATGALLRALARQGAELQTFSADNAATALELQQQHQPAVAVVDLSLEPARGPESGLELIGKLLEQDASLRVLVLTGHGADEFGIRALHLGAASFIQKPADPAHLLALIYDGLRCAQIRRSYTALQRTRPEFAGIKTRNRKMATALEAAALAASHDRPVLIYGETGTGKGVFAAAIHRQSARAAGPFVRSQPAFGNYDLIASELFGHHKGAYTGALEARRGLIQEADGGTLFIDEVDELPAETQIVLLNVLQEKIFRSLGSNREVRSNFRLLAATNRLPEESLAQGKLREDFFHRLAHSLIEIPPLRERPEDIVELAEQFLANVVSESGLNVFEFNATAKAKLLRHQWPGNVRELQAAVETAAFRAAFYQRSAIEDGDLLGKQQLGAAPADSSAGTFRERVQAFELRLVQEALEQNQNNQSRAAEELQLDRSTLRRILER